MSVLLLLFLRPSLGPRGDGTLKGTEGVPSGNPTGGKAERAKKRAEADAGLLGGPSVLRARHAVTALETINGCC